MATSEGIPSSIDIEFLELNDNPYYKKPLMNDVHKRLEGIGLFKNQDVYVFCTSRCAFFLPRQVFQGRDGL